jgi:hypothetical protein
VADEDRAAPARLAPGPSTARTPECGSHPGPSPARTPVPARSPVRAQFPGPRLGVRVGWACGGMGWRRGGTVDVGGWARTLGMDTGHGRRDIWDTRGLVR